MKTKLIQEIAKVASLVVALAMASVVSGADKKETMCVKQRDGTYKCKASGKIEKEPCCETPTNPAPKRTPKPKK
jgi:hypothetical protein